jgi:two-component system, cell cycle response regulator
MADDSTKDQQFTIQTSDQEPSLAQYLIENSTKSPALITVAGMDMGSYLLLNQPSVILGRDPGCTFSIRDDGISRRHAELLRDEGGNFTIHDLGSTNGLFINGIRVEHHKLSEGEKILLGRNTVLQYLCLDHVDIEFHHKMHSSTVRDGLTGIFNRKYFDERLVYEISYSQRHKAPISLLMADLDYFKKVNDQWGHQAGDQILRITAQTIQRFLRSEDVLARYGGEEFAVIARNTDLPSGVELGERLCREVEAMKVFTTDKNKIKLSISIGVTACDGLDQIEPAEFVARADANLYQAKQNGRNRVVSG